MTDRAASAAHALFADAEVLRDDFYAPPRRRARKVVARAELPYDVICISLYKEDLAALDAKVQLLKSKGHRKMSRSALIRFALANVDTSKLPRSY